MEQEALTVCCHSRDDGTLEVSRCRWSQP